MLLSNNLSNEIVLLKSMSDFKLITPFISFEDIFTNVKNLEVEEYSQNIWKVGGSIFFNNNISSPMGSPTYLRKYFEKLFLKRQLFSNTQFDEALDYVKSNFNKGNYTIGSNDISSQFSYKNIDNFDEFKSKWEGLRRFKTISIEETVEGDNLDIFIIRGKIVAIYSLVPAFVIGNGEDSLSELLDKINFLRKKNILYKKHVVRNISSKYDLNSIPNKNEVVVLKTSNKIENGGVFLDLTPYLIESFKCFESSFDNVVKDVDYMVVNCLVSDFAQGVNQKNFKIRSIRQNNADIRELLSCVNSEEVVLNYLSFFSKYNKNITLNKCEEFKNVYLRSADKVDILKEAAYRKGLHVKELGDNVVLFTDKNSNYNVIFKSSMTHFTSFQGRNFTNDKFVSKLMLQRLNINTPNGFKTSINKLNEAWDKCKEFKFPLVLKPLDGSGGIGVTTGIFSFDEFCKAWRICENLNSNELVIEECVQGQDYRVMVVNDNICAVTQRIAAYVIGDGVNSISELIRIKSIKRLENPFYSLKKFTSNEVMINYLLKMNLTLSCIPSFGARIKLLDAVNIGSGGESIDKTDEMHPDWHEVAVKVREAVLNPFHLGFDLMAEDITLSPKDQSWSIIEVNLNPDLGLQIFPSVGLSRDIGMTLLDAAFGDINPNVVTYKFNVYGKVQNVGFRKWLKKICDLRSVYGCVSNNPLNNDVISVIVKGPRETLDDVLKSCFNGPKAARVSKVCLVNGDFICDYNEFLIK